MPVNIITDANHTSYVSDLTQTEITAGDSINMNVQIPRDTTMVIEYETGGRWIPHKRVPASTSRFDSQSVALNPPFAKTPGNYKFRTFLVDKNTGIILPH